MFGMLLKVSLHILFVALVKLCCLVGFRKKVKAVAKQKDCELVGEWEQSIINHMYWCVASIPSGDGNMMVAKWLSLVNHIHNKHLGHGKPFRKCTHGRLVGRN